MKTCQGAETYSLTHAEKEIREGVGRQQCFSLSAEGVGWRGRGLEGGRWEENKKKKKGKLNKIAFEQKSHFLLILEPNHNLGHLTTQFVRGERGCDLG